MKLLPALLLGVVAAASAGPMDAVRLENETLANHLDTCAIKTRTLFVKIRGGLPMDSGDDVKACAAEGKATLKASHDKLKAAFGKKPPAQLTDWRIEWMTAFDGSVPQDGETERGYLQRQAEAKAGISRATNKLELSLE